MAFSFLKNHPNFKEVEGDKFRSEGKGGVLTFFRNNEWYHFRHESSLGLISECRTTLLLNSKIFGLLCDRLKVDSKKNFSLKTLAGKYANILVSEDSSSKNDFIEYKVVSRSSLENIYVSLQGSYYVFSITNKNRGTRSHYKLTAIPLSMELFEETFLLLGLKLKKL